MSPMLTRRDLLAAVPVAAAAAAAAQLPQGRPRFRPRIGVLGDYTDSNLDWVKAEGFTSMQLRLDPAKVSDARIAQIKSRIEQSGLYISSLAVDGNHIDP